MVEHCDKCGTELDPDQPRHQRYTFEYTGDGGGITTGRLCSDCFFEFEDWLETKSITESG